jgi:hypothetical protein
MSGRGGINLGEAAFRFRKIGSVKRAYGRQREVEGAALPGFALDAHLSA